MRIPPYRPASLVLTALVAGCQPQVHERPSAVRWMPIDASANKWIQHGPIGAVVETVRVGRVPLQGPNAGQTSVAAFAATVRVRWSADRSIPCVMHAPFQPPRRDPVSDPALLENVRGERYGPLIGGDFDRALGRRRAEKLLTDDDPDVIELLTFEARAADEDELILTLPSSCRAVAGDEAPTPTGPLPTDRPPFRFRLLRWMWASSN